MRIVVDSTGTSYRTGYCTVQLRYVPVGGTWFLLIGGKERAGPVVSILKVEQGYVCSRTGTIMLSTTVPNVNECLLYSYRYLILYE